jgi:hypothetical protein
MYVCIYIYILPEFVARISIYLSLSPPPPTPPHPPYSLSLSLSLSLSGDTSRRETGNLPALNVLLMCC